MSKSPEPVDPREKFKVALEKKKSLNTRGLNIESSEVSSKLHAASGKKPKMFRRKSG